MKRFLLVLGLVIIGFSACKKEKTVSAAEQAAIDDKAIQAYLAANPSITATKDPSGVYYQVLTAGTGAFPTSTSTVSVNYTGKLLSGSQFDAGTLNKYSLTGLIEGWRYGIPHVQAGRRILLIIPSGLGYGTTSPSGKIPANSVLVFTIDLLSFS